MIEIRPHTGDCRGREVDLGIDALFLVDGKHLRPGMLIGFAERKPGADLLLIVNQLPPALVKEARAALDKRDVEGLPEDKAAMAAGAVALRSTVVAPTVEDEAEEEEDE